MIEGGRGRLGRPSEQGRTITNTHIHIPPNFSAFESAEEAVDTAAREGVRVLGTSNFHDARIYARFADAARAACILPLFGLEFISVVDALRDAGTRVNDPGNPGRVYVCGKGIDPFTAPAFGAASLMHRARAADANRMRTMVALVRARFAAAGLETALTPENIAADVAEQSSVPGDWVVLQERHVAMAFQEAVFLAAAPERRRALLARAIGVPFGGSVNDPIGVQDAIRSALMKAGGPAFVPESPVSFHDAMSVILGLGGIPCYPTLADGASPVCPWEEPPAGLAERLQASGIFVAELIPGRNRPSIVDAYVSAFRESGIIVMAGTEHNTRARIPLEPRCLDGSLPSSGARAAFWEATCVVAAHQHLRVSGKPGYVDGEGRLNPGFPDGTSRVRWFAEMGQELIGEASRVAAR